MVEDEKRKYVIVRRAEAVENKPSWLERARTIAAEIELDLLHRFPGLVPERCVDGRGLPHALFMAQHIQSSDEIDSDTKACRWLGYLQAMLVYEGVTNLAKAKQANLDSGVVEQEPWVPSLYQLCNMALTSATELDRLGRGIEAGSTHSNLQVLLTNNLEQLSTDPKIWLVLYDLAKKLGYKQRTTVDLKNNLIDLFTDHFDGELCIKLYELCSTTLEDQRKQR